MIFFDLVHYMICDVINFWTSIEEWNFDLYWRVKVFILLVFWEILELLIDVSLWIISLLNMMFSVGFDRMLYFQGFEGISGGIVVIFDVVKSGGMLDFSGFCRSGYRSGVLGWFEVKCLGNADFTRSLWVEQMYLVCNRTLVLKM